MKRLISALCALVAFAGLAAGQIKSMSLTWYPAEGKPVTEKTSFTYNADGTLSAIIRPWGAATTLEYHPEKREVCLSGTTYLTFLPTYSGMGTHENFTCAVAENFLPYNVGEMESLGGVQQFLYQEGNCTYTRWEEFTTNGGGDIKLTWNGNLLEAIDSNGPADDTFEIREITYLADANPFGRIDPTAYLLFSGAEIFWQGFAGNRPARLVGGYRERIGEWGYIDPEAPWTTVSFLYDKDAQGRITAIREFRDGRLVRSVSLTY